MKKAWLEHWDSESWHLTARRNNIPVLLQWELVGGWHTLFIRDKRTLLKVLKLGAEDIEYVDDEWKDHLEQAKN